MKTLWLRIALPWRLALFVFVAAALNYADRAALFSVIPPLREDLGVTDTQVGLLGSLFLWSYALASPWAGALADRYSRRRIVVGSLVAWSLLTLLMGFAANVGSLLALRVGLGLAESLYLPAAAALLADYHTTATRGRAMGLHLLGLNLGALLGGAVAGSLAELHGWRLGFWVLGGAGLLLALAARHSLPPPGEPGPAASRPRRAVGLRAAYAYLLRVPSFYIMLAGAVIAGVASWIFLTWLPLFFRENFAMNLGLAGLVGLGLFKLPGAAGIALGGWLSDRMARRGARHRVMIKAWSFLLSGPILLLFLGTPGFALVAIVLVASSLIRAMGSPSEHPILCDIVPPVFRSSAIGLMNTCGTAAGGLGVLLAGILKQDWGLNSIFAGSALLFVLAGALMLLAYFVFMERDVARARAFEEACADDR